MNEAPPPSAGRDAPAAEVRSRSEQRRGPKAAAPRQKERSSGKHLPSHYGGYPLDTAERHLLNYHRQFGENGRDDMYFRTTRALVVAARRWRKIANDRIKSRGQTMARWETLYLVAFSGDELTQSELARLLGVEGPTMVHMLNALAEDGLIERRQSSADRRVTVNSITPSGMQVIRDIMGVTNALRREVLKPIEPGKLSVTLETLSLILRQLEEMR
jgi:MarR family transcriptional regulator for hemolysin